MNAAVFSVSAILVLTDNLTPRFPKEFYKSRSNTAHLVVVNSTEIAFGQTIADEEKALKRGEDTQERNNQGDSLENGEVERKDNIKGFADLPYLWLDSIMLIKVDCQRFDNSLEHRRMDQLTFILSPNILAHLH